MTPQDQTKADPHAHHGLASILQLVIGAALILFGCLWFTGALAPLSALLGGQQLEQSNAAYIQSVQSQSMTDLITLGEMLAIVDVVASIEVGFNFVASAEVSIGHAIETFAQLLRRAAEVLVLSAGAFELLTLLLAIAKAISGPLFALSLISLGLFQITRGIPAFAHIHRLLSDLTFLALSLFVLSYIILPYSVQISAWCSVEITQTLHAAARDGLAALQTDIGNGTASPQTPQDWTHRGTSIAAFEHMSHELPQKMKSATWLVWSFLANGVIHALLVPLTAALVLRQIMHRVLRFVLAR